MKIDERTHMTEIQDSWKEVAGKAEALGLKLKLHLEQEQDAEQPHRSEGDTKAMVDELGKKLNDAFESFGNAAKDPAVHEDVKDVGRLFRDALVTTFNAVGAEVSSRTNTGDAASDTPAPPTPQDVVVDDIVDSGAGDEGDGSDA